MVTLNQYGANGSVYYGLHDDIKPSGDNVQNGSIFVEIDTGKVYFFNADGAAWVEQFSFQA